VSYVTLCWLSKKCTAHTVATRRQDQRLQICKYKVQQIGDGAWERSTFCALMSMRPQL
jgi:hypothetical protein